jgi:hypothetical protein
MSSLHETQPEQNGPTTNDKATKNKKLSGAGTVVAVTALIIWAVFAGILLANAGTKNVDLWAHLTWVFGSIQAIAFTAAGALFGTAVQQDRVKNAETRAASAESAASNGRVLAKILQSEAAPTSGSGSEGVSPDADVRQRHAALARSLFGDLLQTAEGG